MRILHLFGAVTQPEIISFLRTQCVFQDEKEIGEILKDWSVAARKFHQITQMPSSLPVQANVNDIPEEYSNKLNEVTSGTLFKNTFSLLPYSLKMVDIKKVVAAQRYVNLDYIEKLISSFPDKIDTNYMIDFCLKKEASVSPVSELANSSNVYSFKSESSDFRFLGGYPKEITQDDLRICNGGGQPVSALILFVGYGSPAINLFQVGGRLILNNGFHRLYALLKKGINMAPVVIQSIQNWSIELPPIIAGLPREYLMNTPRPTMMEDFINQNLTKELTMKDRDKAVQVQWIVNQTDIPK